MQAAPFLPGLQVLPSRLCSGLSLRFPDLRFFPVCAFFLSSLLPADFAQCGSAGSFIPSSVRTVASRSWCECSQTCLCLEEFLVLSGEYWRWCCDAVPTWIRYLPQPSREAGSSCTPTMTQESRTAAAGAPALGTVPLLNVGRCRDRGSSMSLGFCLHFSEDWQC